jgi:hypothetical protein
VSYMARLCYRNMIDPKFRTELIKIIKNYNSSNLSSTSLYKLLKKIYQRNLNFRNEGNATKNKKLQFFFSEI